MHTQCNTNGLHFQPCGRRAVVLDFEAGHVTTDAGALLLREVDTRIGLMERVAACCEDHRDQRRVEHPLRTLLTQRVFGLACGYEDLNDHDELRRDPLMALAVGHADAFGENRRQPRDRGKPLAGHATLNRIETAANGVAEGRRDLKIVPHLDQMADLLLDLFVEAQDKVPEEIILDVDATDDLVHGTQEGRFYHGYYHGYCYLPLYIFAGEHLLVAKLRTADKDGANGTLEELQRIVTRLRRAWPQVRFILRGDSGFCRENLMCWCEETDGVDYILGLAQNPRLQKRITSEMATVKEKAQAAEKAQRHFKELRYQTRSSWARERRVVAKVEHLVSKANARFVVTSLATDVWEKRALYEDLYCARGEMENRLKEQQLGLFADRTSAHQMPANQLRLFYSSFAYVLLHALRRLALKTTKMARSQVWTIRLKLLKLGALIKRSHRRYRISCSTAHSSKPLFEEAFLALQKLPVAF